LLELLNHDAKFGGARFSPAAGVAKNVEFYRHHCSQRNAPVFKLLVARFWGFSSPSVHLCTDGVKFGTEEGTKGPFLRAKFHPHGAMVRL